MRLMWMRPPNHLGNDVMVATQGRDTYVLTRDREAGKKNRFSLVVVSSGKKMIVLGQELPPGQCRAIAQRAADL